MTFSKQLRLQAIEINRLQLRCERTKLIAKVENKSQLLLTTDQKVPDVKELPVNKGISGIYICFFVNKIYINPKKIKRIAPHSHYST